MSSSSSRLGSDSALGPLVSWRDILTADIKIAHTQVMSRTPGNQTFDNGNDLLEGIDGFVNALSPIPEALGQLRQNAIFIRSRCEEGSTFFNLKSIALSELAKHADQSLDSASSEFADNDIDELAIEPLFQDCLRQVIRGVDRVVVGNSVAESTLKALQVWKQEAERILNEADRINADGCWWLYFANNLNPQSDGSKPGARDWIAAGVGGHTYLHPMQRAAESVVQWTTQPSQFNAGSKRRATFLLELADGDGGAWSVRTKTQVRDHWDNLPEATQQRYDKPAKIPGKNKTAAADYVRKTVNRERKARAKANNEGR